MDHHIGNYKYSPLREGERRWHTTGDIRILELLPGSFEDPLHCRLRVAAIESDPAYDALSYMWGNPLSPKGRIFLDDELFPVTESLENALRHVRLRDSVRYLWADAVCINQRDIKERGNQVHLMKEIYSRSKTVRAWIDIDLSPENPVVRKLLTLDLEGTIDQLGEDPEFWRILLPLLQDEYWNRLWIQQELVFAPELVFYCRGVDIPGNCLMAFQLQIFRKLTDGMGPFNTDDPWSLFRPLDSTTKAPSRNLACWRAMVEMQVPVDPYTLEPDWSLEKPMAAWALDPRKWGPHLSTSSIYMLGMLRQSQALKLTDSRDRVTAVLNLVIDYEDDGSQADYEQSLAEKYLRVARLLLFKCNGLLFLAVTKTSTNPNDNIQGLPSWAPNWDSPGNAEYLLSAFHAVGDLPMYGTPFQGDMDDGVLYARGFKYATVDQTLSTTNNALTPLWVLLNLFVSTVESAVYHYDDIKKLAFTLTGPAMAELRIPRDYFNENEAVVYTGVLLGHSLVNPDLRIVDLLPCATEVFDYSERKIRAALLALRKSFGLCPSCLQCLYVEGESNSVQETCVKTERFGNFMQLVHKTLSSGCLASIISSKVTPTTVPTTTLAITEGKALVNSGDEIWILFGCPIPMVLRRTGSYFLVASPAYIPDIMNGEAMEEVDTPDDKFGGWGILGLSPAEPYVSEKNQWEVNVIRLR